MKIHLLKEKTIREYCRKHARAQPSFDNWLKQLRGCEWNTPWDIVETYPSTDFLGNGTSRVVFDVGGNNYRMIGQYVFRSNKVCLYVCWIGTHAEYDELCSKNRQYSVWDF